jgi:hypothetical protein
MQTFIALRMVTVDDVLDCMQEVHELVSLHCCQHAVAHLEAHVKAITPP